MNCKGRLKLLFLLPLLLSVALVNSQNMDQNYSTPERLADRLLKDYVTRVLKNSENQTLLDYTEIAKELKQFGDGPYIIEEGKGDRRLGPGMECAYYNHDACESHGKCEITKEICYPEAHLRVSGCYAVFNYPPVLDNDTMNSTDNYIPVEKSQLLKLGCIQMQDTEMMGCIHKEICRQSQLVRAVGHCCCSTPNCNGGILEQINPNNWDKVMEITSGSSRSKNSGLKEKKYLGTVTMFELILLLSAVLCLLAICLIAFIAYQWNKRNREYTKIIKAENEKTNALEAGNMPLVGPEQDIEMVPTPKELPITDFLLISKGQFASVYRAKWTNENGEEKYVAVKKLTEKQGALDFIAEKKVFETLSQYRWYSSIVGYYCAEKIGNELWVVTEFHERLSLFDLLKSNAISITACGRILLSMIDGLQFLHDDRPFFAKFSKKPIIHRDIKSKNILIKSDMTACIADFGLSRVYEFGSAERDLASQVGTKRYMPPEMLLGAVDFNAIGVKAMDVYSMALVMWETISRTQLNYEDKVPPYRVPYYFAPQTDVGALRALIVTKKKRPEWRPELLENEHTKLFAKLTEEMWEHEASARITAGCAFARIWNHVMRSTTGSEGYHTEEENSYSSFRTPDTEKMTEYHADYTKCHPTPDPKNDDCPPLPPLPNVTEDGIKYDEAPDAIPEEIYVEPPKPKEIIFNIETHKVMTDEEMIEYQAKKATQALPFDEYSAY